MHIIKDLIHLEDVIVKISRRKNNRWLKHWHSELIKALKAGDLARVSDVFPKIRWQLELNNFYFDKYILKPLFTEDQWRRLLL